jgi:hypothetical protein
MPEETILDASTGKPQVMPMPKQQMASIINVPPQIAVTICWVALGIGIGLYISHKSRSPKGRRVILGD